MATDREFEKMLISTFEIQRPEKTEDGAGGFTTTYNSLGTIKGRLSLRGTSRATDRVRAMQDIADYNYQLFTLPDADIQKDDKVIGEGKEMRVIIVKEPSHNEHHLQVELEDLIPSGGI